MGTTTNAILCYGFRLKDENGEEEDIRLDWLCKSGDRDGCDDDECEMDFDDFLAKLIGLASPEPEDQFNEERYKNDSVYKKMWTDYFARRRGLSEELGISLVTHCSGEYSRYILAATPSVHEASRDDPVELGQSVTAESEWRETIFRFCEKAGIKFEEPQWILCSYWST